MTSNQVSDEISIPLARISNAYENWKCAPEERKAFHAATIRRELAGAGAALTTLQEMFGDVNSGNQARFTNAQMVETAKDAGGVLVIKAEVDPIEMARQLVASGKRGRLETELGLYDQSDRIISQTETRGHTVGRNIHYQRSSSLAYIKQAVRESEAS